MPGAGMSAVAALSNLGILMQSRTFGLTFVV
jgi:hypothetical protein